MYVLFPLLAVIFENLLSRVIIVIKPNRAYCNAYFKVRKLKQKIPSAIDEKTENFLAFHPGLGASFQQL